MVTKLDKSKLEYLTYYDRLGLAFWLDSFVNVELIFGVVSISVLLVLWNHLWAKRFDGNSTLVIQDCKVGTPFPRLNFCANWLALVVSIVLVLVVSEDLACVSVFTDESFLNFFSRLDFLKLSKHVVLLNQLLELLLGVELLLLGRLNGC